MYATSCVSVASTKIDVTLLVALVSLLGDPLQHGLSFAYPGPWAHPAHQIGPCTLDP